MVIDDLVFRIEVLDAGERWVPYTAEAVGLREDEVDLDLVGDQDLIDVWQDPLEFARTELERAATSIASTHERLARLAGLRILVWQGRSSAGEPDVVLRTNHEQLAVGRLRLAADSVAEAVEGLRRARQRLRAQVLAAVVSDHLGRNRIAREVERTLSRRLVLQHLAGYDLIGEIRAALPAEWERWDGFQDSFGDPEPNTPWAPFLGPFRCGPVWMELSGSGQVELRIVESVDPPFFDASEERMEVYQREARRRALEAAEVVHAALNRRHIQLLAEDGGHVSVNELSKSTVTVARPERQPSGQARTPDVA